MQPCPTLPVVPQNSRHSRSKSSICISDYLSEVNHSSGAEDIAVDLLVVCFSLGDSMCRRSSHTASVLC